MFVDSTALPEQVVDDVIASGFQSAGQRCSALRVLFLQEDVADKIIEMIKGALAELHVGDPAFLSTDVGPVIDERALGFLNDHVEYLKDKSTLHYECKIPEMGDKGHYFFAPRLYEISDLTILQKEVFGPCVHIIRYHASDIDNVIEQINNTGFGLTMGIHTRIEEKSAYLAKRSRAGNIYINRNMIGAVVGVQPFGGRELSGTGPKAGGPMYLTRLVKEPQLVEDNHLSETEREILDAQFKEYSASSWKIAAKLQTAKNDESKWQNTNVKVRVSIARQLLAKIASHKLFTSQESDLEAILDTARKQLSQIEAYLKAPTILPGPTGESNQLYLESRGILACIGDKDTSFEYWLISIVTALATGNSVIALVSDSFLAEAIACEKELHELGLVSGIFQAISFNYLPAILTNVHLRGVVITSNSALKQFVLTQLAARKGAILPIITAQSPKVLMQRLVTEKTITIDTTAAGGNASLMTLEASNS